MITENQNIFFTAPWDPLVVRRGDALGLRALADQFADAIAPHFSNRIIDGRWITILAWCLARSHGVFHASGGRSIETRAQQNERYAWLRPLELMWVARTINLAGDDWRQRSLAGQRSVKPWYEKFEQRSARFGMSVDQYSAYRQTGIYGGYRLAFRKWPRLTVGGNGWTPGLITNSLAQWLDARLGGARPDWPLHIGDGDDEGLSSRSIKKNRGDEDRWWLKAWPAFDQGARNAEFATLPRLHSDYSKLPEADILNPLIYGSYPYGSHRLAVVRQVEKSSARSHLEVCEFLSRAFADNRIISVLPVFSRLADAGMAALDLAAQVLGSKPSVALSTIAEDGHAKVVCEELYAAARLWNSRVGIEIPHAETAGSFASSFSNARPQDCFSALLKYHEINGGGLRWFVLRNGNVEARTPQRSGSSRYRFRLWSLCRLAAQCGILSTMPKALRLDAENSGETDE